jgi:hypothetical protein
MGWIWLFMISVLIFLLAIPFKKWIYYWPAGVVTMIIIYAIDSTLIKLGAFSYYYPNYIIGKLPLFYWVSSFFAGILLVYYFPKRKIMQFPYILLTAFMFLCLELIMKYFNYITYHNWSSIYSFFLDISGFIIVIWLFFWISNTFKGTANGYNNKNTKIK